MNIKRNPNAKRGVAIGEIWFPDALAENDIPDYSDYVNEVARLANKMGKIHGVCLDTVRDSFNHNVPVGKTALSVYHDSCYWEYGF